MCKRHLIHWHCGCHKAEWDFCEYRKTNKDKPCVNYTLNAHYLENCCSSQCCEKAIQNWVDRVEKFEQEGGIAPNCNFENEQLKCEPERRRGLGWMIRKFRTQLANQRTYHSENCTADSTTLADLDDDGSVQRTAEALSSARISPVTDQTATPVSQGQMLQQPGLLPLLPPQPSTEPPRSTQQQNRGRGIFDQPGIQAGYGSDNMTQNQALSEEIFNFQNITSQDLEWAQNPKIWGDPRLWEDSMMQQEGMPPAPQQFQQLPQPQQFVLPSPSNVVPFQRPAQPAFPLAPTVPSDAPSGFRASLPYHPLPQYTEPPALPIVPAVPSDASSGFRASVYNILPQYTIPQDMARQDQNTSQVQPQTSVFRNSHFNTAHYMNPDFQPEQWDPDDEYITMVNGSSRRHRNSG